MPIVQAGRTFTADDVKRTAGNLASIITDGVQQGGDFRIQLESWPDADMITLGLSQEEVNALKGFFVGDLPALATLLAQSVWIKQLLGTGV
jgi:hypothetical protein